MADSGFNPAHAAHVQAYAAAFVQIMDVVNKLREETPASDGGEHYILLQLGDGKEVDGTIGLPVEFRGKVFVNLPGKRHTMVVEDGNARVSTEYIAKEQ